MAEIASKMRESTFEKLGIKDKSINDNYLGGHAPP